MGFDLEDMTYCSCLPSGVNSEVMWKKSVLETRTKIQVRMSPVRSWKILPGKDLGVIF